jgi:hypothetical protein
MRKTLILAVAFLMLLGNVRAGSAVSVLQTMHKMLDQLAKGNLEGAKKYALSHAEFTSISKRKIDKKEYQGHLEGFMRMISRELQAGVKLERIGHTDVVILPKGEKTRREVVMAVIHATFKIKGKLGETEPITFLFVSHGGKWKFFLRN